MAERIRESFGNNFMLQMKPKDEQFEHSALLAEKLEAKEPDFAQKEPVEIQVGRFGAMSHTEPIKGDG